MEKLEGEGKVLSEQNNVTGYDTVDTQNPA